MKNSLKHLYAKTNSVYFWQRLLLTTALLFLVGILSRFASNPVAGIFTTLVFFGAVISALWSLLSVFQKDDAWTRRKKPPRPIWIRIVVAVSLAPILLSGGLAFGFGTGLAIQPYSTAEIAENEARAEAERVREEAREAAEEARKEAEAQLEADRAAAEKALKEERERREAAEKAAAEEAQKAQREQEAREAAAEKEARDQQEKLDAEEGAASEAEKRQAEQYERLRKLKDSDPLLHAREYCDTTLRLIRSDFRVHQYISTSNDGSSFFLTTRSAQDPNGALAYACVRQTLGFSDVLISSIGTTTALSGTRTWSENGMDLQWTYHPTNGLNLSIVGERECFLFFCS
jgi:hypothetical protein